MTRNEKIRLLEAVKKGKAIIRIKEALLFKVGNGPITDEFGRAYSREDVERIFERPLILELSTKEQVEIIKNAG